MKDLLDWLGNIATQLTFQALGVAWDAAAVGYAPGKLYLDSARALVSDPSLTLSFDRPTT